LGRDNAELRIQAIAWLSDAPTPSMVSAFVLALQDTEERVRVGAAWGLAQLDYSPAIPAIVTS
jgi:HEAT repeat protein